MDNRPCTPGCMPRSWVLTPIGVGRGFGIRLPLRLRPISALNFDNLKAGYGLRKVRARASKESTACPSAAEAESYIVGVIAAG